MRLGTNLWNSSREHQDKLMVWAAMLMAFHGFMRISEYTSSHARSYNPSTTLCWDDITIMPNTVKVRIKASKTDPFRTGVDIMLYRNHSPLCPVQALIHYSHHHPFPHGPLFTWKNGSCLTRSSFSRTLQKIKPPDIANMSTHSFRIGAATTAAAAGFPRWLIQALGRWSSDCYREYIRIPPTTLKNVSHSLAMLTHTPTTPFDPDNVS